MLVLALAAGAAPAQVLVQQPVADGAMPSAAAHVDKVTTSATGKAPSVSLTQTITGETTQGQPATGYLWSFDAANIRASLSTSSGHNQSPVEPIGRTGVASIVSFAQNNGNGDVGAYYGFCEVNSAGRPGARHWLAMPACVLLNGDIGTHTPHSYLNQFEFNLSDNGMDTAAIAITENFHRTNNRAAWGEIWIGDRWQSTGTKAIDVGWSGTGRINVGLDLVAATADATWNGGHTVAVNMAAGQRVIFNSTATPLNGINWYGNVPGDAYDVYDGDAGVLSRCKGSTCLHVGPRSAVFAGATPAATIAVEARNADSGQSSLAKLTASHGSGSAVDLVASAAAGIVNSATQPLSFAVGNTPYVTIGTDGVTRLSGGIQLLKTTVSALPRCVSGLEGGLYAVTDAVSDMFNAVLKGGGSHHVMAYCNGTNWTAH